ncbi:hypothetical protein RQM40_02465 [Citrobacter portucalensis]|uniref:hypothetical protein n=1 Tax=Citrobacter portucalensis TaxID=1639133 RepID=UPI003896DF69
MKKDILHRKFKKLLRNPKQFFVDSRPIKNAPLKKTELNVKSEIKNVLGSLYIHDSNKISLKIDKPIKPLNHDFSSIIVKLRKSSNPKNEPIYSNLIANPKNFLGFREQNIILLDAQEATLKSHLDLKALHDKPWNTTPFADYRNVFIIDPTNNLPLLLKSTSPLIKVHCIFTEKVTTEEVIRSIKWSEGIDLCIVHKSHEFPVEDIKKIYYFSSTNQLIDAVNNVILIHGSKPYDLLVPSFGDIPFLENIDNLNESECDVYIKLKKKTKLTSNKLSFSEFIHEMSKDVEYILCRESILQRYDNIINHYNIEKFLSYISIEGLRLEISDQ